MNKYLLHSILILALLFSCGGNTDDAAQADQVSNQEETSEQIQAEVVVDNTALTVAEDVPFAVSVDANDDHLPTEIQLRFSQELVKSSQIGKAIGSNTIIQMVPSIEGTWTWSGSNRIVFKPKDRFQFKSEIQADKYTVQVKQVESPDGILKPQDDVSWDFTFTAIQPRILDIAMVSANASRGNYSLTIRTNGPLSANSLEQNLEIELRNRSINEFTVRKDNDYKYSLYLNNLTWYSGENLLITAPATISSEGGGARLQSPFSKSFSSQKIEPVEIRDVQRQNSNSGYYINVQARDSADERNRRNWYTYADFDADVVENYISFEPAVTFSVSPSINGFRIFGDFKKGQYRLTIAQGLYTRLGGILQEDYSSNIQMPLKQPTLDFVSKGRYLPRDYMDSLPINHRNVSTVTVTVRQIFEQNIAYWLSSSGEQATDQISDQIASKRFTLNNIEDETLTSWIELQDFFPDDIRGVFEISLRSGNTSSTARIMLTDLAVIIKQHGKNDNNYGIWVLDVHSSKPVSGAQVQVLTKSNRVLESKRSDGQGFVSIDSLSDSLAKQDAYALIIKQGDDMTALRLSDLIIDTQEFRVQGLPYDLSNAYLASIYSDSGVYRPGDTANISMIVREGSNIAPEEGLPLIGEIYDPQNKQITSIRTNTNKAGMAAVSLDLPSFASTGRYQFKLKIGGNIVETYGFNVEEFVPERMRVTLDTNADSYLRSEMIPIQIDAQYLFGTSASGEAVELTCTLEQGSFSPPINSSYSYGVFTRNAFQPLSIGTFTGEMDEEGKITLTCPSIDQLASFPGAARVYAQAAVFESGSGRTTVNSISIPVHRSEQYIGLKSSTKKANGGEPVLIDGILVDLDGEVISSNKEVVVEIRRISSEWVWEYDAQDGRYRYRRFIREIPVKSITAVVDGGRFRAEFIPESYVEGYVVEARLDDAISSFVIDGDNYSYWWYYYYSDSSSDNQVTPRPTPPDEVPIMMSSELKKGENADVSFAVPYAGRMLITIETDEVISTEWVDVEAGTFEYKFKVNDFYPNVYVSSFLIRKTADTRERMFLPGRAFGVLSVDMVPEEFTLTPEISVPDEIRPNSTLNVSLDLGSQPEESWATVAVVDEGILQLTKFQSPDPHDTLFKQRALDVSTFETFGWTLRVPAQSSLTGGDAEEEQRGRIMPVKPVILFSGLVSVPKNGKVVVPFDIPEYRGELRVMVVAANSKRSGSNDTSLKVREPIVVQPTIPRFVIGEDQFKIPVFVTNLTGSDGNFTISMATDEAVKITGSGRTTISIEAGKSKTVVFGCEVLQKVGSGNFTVTVSGNGQESVATALTPILPNSPEVSEVTMVELTNGNNDLSSLLEGWNPQYETTSIWITANKYAESLGHLKYVIRYPYGCIEQTTSSTRPLLYIGDLLKFIDPEVVQNTGIEEKFMHGANRLLSMQTSSGGFSYWPGATQPTYWGTAYASHALYQGLEAGYPIPKDRLDEAFTFMEEALNGDTTLIDPKYGYSVEKSEPYMQYVLALVGRGRAGRILQLIQNPRRAWDELEEENLYLLKAALYLTGDRRYERDLKDLNTEITARRRNGWSFWTDFRSKGMILSVYEELFPGGAEGEVLADTIAARFQADQSNRFTTQEISWGTSALGKRVSMSASGWSTPVLTVGGKKQDMLFSDERSSDSLFYVEGASDNGPVILNVERIRGGKLYARVTVEGLKPDAVFRTGSESISVTRRYLNSAGREVNLSDLKLGDLIFVELSLRNLTSSKIQNIALVDNFPAGIEVENPRLNRSYSTDWITTNGIWEPDHMEIRDYQIMFFGHVAGGARVRTYYVARVVTAGTFTHPPVSAEAMYDPDVWALVEGREVQIQGPW
jgi:uncharacterized protein YfaS (alpha-2-macroglobulin family)